MRVVLQRVTGASVTVDGQIHAAIDRGFLLLVGVGDGDTARDAEALSDKCVGLRVFEDEAGKMNRSLLDAGGEILAVSNFTLYADCRRGRRPSFSAAARPESAEGLFDTFVERCRAAGARVKTGVFGADMLISLQNDGPVTLVIDSSLL